MAAEKCNKFPGVRAATCENIAAAKSARAANNANVLCLGKLVTPPDEAKQIVDSFLEQKFISQPG
jgi:ribose 5-phosphate isomerase B